MCQMLSPERAVIWSILHNGELGTDVADLLRADYFTHPPYRRWFEVARQSEGVFEAEGFLALLENAGPPPTHADRQIGRAHV